MDTFTKQTTGKAAQWEAAGLKWLKEAESSGGASVVGVIGDNYKRDGNPLTIQRVPAGQATAEAAREFGAALAHTHEAGAEAFGAGPDGWEGDGFHGPNDDLLPLSLKHYSSWGTMYAEARIEPTLQLVQKQLGADGVRTMEAACARLKNGDFDDLDTPARIHGDLWAGNVMWSPSGAVLIDPCAHGGHPITDLAALSLFGCSYLDEIYEGYESEGFLNSGWRELIPLHQLSMLLTHVHLFGGSYVRPTIQAASRFA